MSSMSVLAGAKGLSVGDELTFFYPSTEWSMAQGFHCLCGTEQCRGYISGAKDMSKEQLEGIWINAHIRSLLEERDGLSSQPDDVRKKKMELPSSENGVVQAPQGQHGSVTGKLVDVTEEALKASLEQARKMVDAAQKALDAYISIHVEHNNWTAAELGSGGRVRRGVTSREMSGEMGGDTQPISVTTSVA